MCGMCFRLHREGMAVTFKTFMFKPALQRTHVVSDDRPQQLRTCPRIDLFGYE
jgi:hypothetical protein